MKSIDLKMGKKERGITLIALVITIIVLLILAGVTVEILTGDNGLLTRAGEAKEKNNESEICEQIKLAYAEWQLAQYDGTDKTADKIIEDSLKTTYGENIRKVKVKNGKVTVNMLVNTQPKTYIYKVSTGKAYEYKDLFDYKEKEKKDLLPGDDISIGNENFRVFYNQDGVIKAMPWYNLKLDSNPIRQATEEEAQNEQEGTSSFASSGNKYWATGSDAIDMTDSRNNIQKYINSYETTIKNFGSTEIEMRAVRYSEIGKQAWSNAELEVNTSNITDEMRNPGNFGSFWTGSGYKINQYMVLTWGRKSELLLLLILENVVFVQL